MSASDDWSIDVAAVPEGVTTSNFQVLTADPAGWHALGSLGSGATNRLGYAVTDDPSNWRMEVALVDGDPLATSSYVAVWGIGAGNGKLVASVNLGSSETFLIVNNQPGRNEWVSASWGSPVPLDSIAYADGVWAGLASDGELYTATDPTGTWTLQHTFDDGDAMRHLDGKWVVAYMGETEIFVWSADDPTGSWTARGSFEPTYAGGIDDLGYGPDGFFILRYNEIYYRPSLTTESWSLAYSFPVPGPGVLLPQGMAYGGGEYVAAAQGFVYVADTVTGPYIEYLTADEGEPIVDVFSPVWSGDEWGICGLTLASSSPYATRAAAWATTAGGDGWGVLLS